MAEIYLVRHGQASFNSDNYDQLSDLGRQQSEFLGQYFAERDISFDQIFTGTQLRHSQTADGIFQYIARPAATTLPGFNEYDFSALYKAYMAQHPEEENAAQEGDRRIFYRRLKHALKLWSKGQLKGNLPESWLDFNDRVAGALHHIREFSISENSGGTYLVVSSGGAISMATGHILGLAPQKVIDLNLQIKNASFSHFYLGIDAMHLSSFNNIPHLDRHDRLSAITFS